MKSAIKQSARVAWAFIADSLTHIRKVREGIRSPGEEGTLGGFPALTAPGQEHCEEGLGRGGQSTHGPEGDARETPTVFILRATGSVPRDPGCRVGNRLEGERAHRPPQQSGVTAPSRSIVHFFCSLTLQFSVPTTYTVANLAEEGLGSTEGDSGLRLPLALSRPSAVSGQGCRMELVLPLSPRASGPVLVADWLREAGYRGQVSTPHSLVKCLSPTQLPASQNSFVVLPLGPPE